MQISEWTCVLHIILFQLNTVLMYYKDKKNSNFTILSFLLEWWLGTTWTGLGWQSWPESWQWNWPRWWGPGFPEWWWKFWPPCPANWAERWWGRAGPWPCSEMSSQSVRTEINYSTWNNFWKMFRHYDWSNWVLPRHKSTKKEKGTPWSPGL